MGIEGKCATCGGDTVDYGCMNCIDQERRGFKAMARQMFLQVDPGWWMTKMDDGQYQRTGGDVQCNSCRMKFYDHPELPKYPTFHLLCDGSIVKL